MTETEVAWAAGFFEGEGHVKLAKRGTGRWFSMEVAQVYREPLDKLQRIFGGKVYGPYGPYTTQRQPYYMYIGYGEVGVNAVKQMLPYLYRKGEQVEAVLQELKEHNDKRKNPVR